jgi:hypothetical protein
MTKIAIALAASTLLGALGMTAASAAPALPVGAAIVAGDHAVDEAAYRHRHYQGMRHRGMGHGRHMRRMPASRMGSNPNSRNPQQPGFMQQKGQTTGGPRY